ncbi:L-threonine dehydratase catabolic TdcB [Toxocara canis]|uniref:L-serine deaminase n=1 Tax=Toxocara canis TaxID=6265 RepID=A0A0B2VF39_TOXCA|nr:L-threonine dehydratase catabolic TdcB [Toxocara canis]
METESVGTLQRRRSTCDPTDSLAYDEKVRNIQALSLETDEILRQEAIRDATPSPEEVELIDPMCDPSNPRKIQFADISAAAYNIRGGVAVTPCTKSGQLSKLLGMELYFKKEFLQATGSFKERGARYALLKLTEEEKRRGVIAASAGNHALALCYHGQSLQIPVTVVMPVIAPLMKISLCRSYGATIILHGDNLFAAKQQAMKLAVENKMRYINGYDHPDILAGQGTVGLEILDQVENVDAIIVPIGGGGLIAGIATAVKTLKPDVSVIGVEAETCPSFRSAVEAGHAVGTTWGGGGEDSCLAVPVVGSNALVTANELVDELVSVSEESVALAILRLIEMEKAIVEGAGAVGLAALLQRKLSNLKGKRVVVVLSGGNIDTTVLGRAIERGLAADSRLVQFDVVVSDRPGGIAELAALLTHQGASIKDIFHERAWVTTDVFSVKVKVVAETRDREHASTLENALRAHYKDNITFHRRAQVEAASEPSIQGEFHLQVKLALNRHVPEERRSSNDAESGMYCDPRDFCEKNINEYLFNNTPINLKLSIFDIQSISKKNSGKMTIFIVNLPNALLI